MLRSSYWILASVAMTGILLAVAATSSGTSGGPTLEVSSPLQGMLTKNATPVVSGLTEPSINVSVTNNHSMYQNDPEQAPRNSTISRPDGAFSMTIRLAEGFQKLDVVATDDHGIRTVFVVQIVLDTTPPKVRIIAPEENLTYTNQIWWDFVAGSLCDCDWDDWFLNELRFDWMSMGVHNKTVPLVDGENEFEVRVLDDLGNTFSQNVTIVRDTVAPELQVIAPAIPTVYTNRDTIYFRGNVRNASGPVQVILKSFLFDTFDTRIVEGEWETNAEWEFNLSLERKNMQWDATVIARDLAGNEVREEFTLVYDDVPPIFDLHPYRMYTNQQRVHLNATTSDDIYTGFINHSFFIFEDGVFQEEFGLWEGWNNVTIIVRDRAGNEVREDISVFRDSVPPTLEVEVPSRVVGRTARIKGTTSEIEGEVLINGVSYPLKDGKFDIEVELDTGDNTFDVSITDLAGNTTGAKVDVVGVSSWLLVVLALLCLMVVVIGWSMKVRRARDV